LDRQRAIGIGVVTEGEMGEPLRHVPEIRG